MDQLLTQALTDFVSDVLTSFPEWTESSLSWWSDPPTQEHIQALRVHCQQVYTPLYLLLLNKNNQAFVSVDPVYLLPGIDFRVLWSCPHMSESSRQVLWDHLTVVCMCLFTDALQEKMDNQDTPFVFSPPKEPTVPRSNTPLFTTGNVFCEEEGPREPRFPSMSFVSSAKDNVQKGGLQGTVGSLAAEDKGSSPREQQPQVPTPDQTQRQEEFLNEFTTNPTLRGIANNIMTGLQPDQAQAMLSNPSQMMQYASTVGASLESSIRAGDLTEAELMHSFQNMMGMMGMPQMASMANMVGPLANMMKSMGGMMGGEEDLSQEDAELKEAAQPHTQSIKDHTKDTQERIKERLRKKALAKHQATTAQEKGCSAKDTTSKGGLLRGTVGSLSTPLSDQELFALFDAPLTKTTVP